MQRNFVAAHVGFCSSSCVGRLATRATWAELKRLSCSWELPQMKPLLTTASLGVAQTTNTNATTNTNTNTNKDSSTYKYSSAHKMKTDINTKAKNRSKTKSRRPRWVQAWTTSSTIRNAADQILTRNTNEELPKMKSWARRQCRAWPNLHTASRL